MSKTQTSTTTIQKKDSARKRLTKGKGKMDIERIQDLLSDLEELLEEREEKQEMLDD